VGTAAECDAFCSKNSVSLEYTRICSGDSKSVASQISSHHPYQKEKDISGAAGLQLG